MRLVYDFKKILYTFIIISSIFLFPVFKNLHNWGIQDWDLDTFYYAVPKMSILDYRQIPLWNPYYCGGTPLLANPQSKFLSPFYLIVLIFGEVVGPKILIWIYSIFGLIGMYYLGKSYKNSLHACLLACFIYMFNSSYSFNIATGMSTFTLIALIPWIFYLYQRIFFSKKYIYLTSIFLSLLFLSGSVQLFIITLAFLFIDTFYKIITNRSILKKITKNLIAIVLLTFLITAPKFIPALELTSRHLKTIPDQSGYSLQSLFFSLLNRSQALISIRKMPWGGNIFYGFYHDIGMEENGLYVGILPLMLTIIGIFFYSKKYKALFLTFLTFGWLMLGNRAPVSLWEFSRFLPILNMARIAQRYRYIFILIFALFCSFGFQYLFKIIKKILGRKISLIFQSLTLIYIFLDLTLVNWRILKDAYTIPPLNLKKDQCFSQIKIMPNFDKFGWRKSDSDMLFRSWSSLYPTSLTNKGTIDCYEPFPFTNNALSADSQKYQGEVYFIGNGQVSYSYWSPNKMIIKVDSKSEGVVVINQNYYPGWKVNNKKLKVQSHNGLLAVKIGSSTNHFELYYQPLSFIIGLVITITSLLFISFLKLKFLIKKVRDNYPFLAMNRKPIDS